MSGGPEDVVESTVCNKAEMDGWLVRKVQWPGRRGAMDHVFAKAGRIVWMEFKQRGKEPDALQQREIERWQKAGAEVYAVSRISEGLKILGIA